jgi:hypothetical protein
MFVQCIVYCVQCTPFHLLSCLPSFSVHRFCHLCPTVWTCFIQRCLPQLVTFLSALIAVSRGGIFSHLVYVYLTWGPVMHVRLTLDRAHLYSLIITTQMAECYWSEESSASFEFEPGTEPQLDLRSARAQLSFRCPWTRVLGLELPAHLALLLPARTGLAYQLPKNWWKM